MPKHGKARRPRQGMSHVKAHGGHVKAHESMSKQIFIFYLYLISFLTGGQFSENRQKPGGVSTKIRDIMYFSEVVVSGKFSKKLLVHVY